MRKNIDLNDKRINEILKEFYNSFENGYVFESFLKIYLEKIGFDEVSITQKSRDGGIDLKAIRKGIGDFSNVDEVEYFIQAKRYIPNATISVKNIRELKGTIPFGNKGIFITTAKFSKDAEREATNDISKPIVLVDGKKLIESCIDNEIGFIFTPIFNKESLLSLLNIQSKTNNTISSLDSDKNDKGLQVEKVITANDIRARIISVPRMIMNQIPNNYNEIDVVINGKIKKKMSINKGRNYLARTTDVFKELGLIEEDGSFNPKKAMWSFNNNTIFIEL